MKLKSLAIFAIALAPLALMAQISDPVADFKTGLTIPSGDKVLKWTCDLNGDGKNEVLLGLKSDKTANEDEHDTPAWELYIADASGTTYTKSAGMEIEASTVDPILPAIDTGACFVGTITELGKVGIVTMQIDEPDNGESVGTIYAYTLEAGGILKRTQLAQYTIANGAHALFNKYLEDGKRTVVTIQELTP